MADRRPLNPGVVVPKPGGGTQPRDRNNDGRVRRKTLGCREAAQIMTSRHTVLSNRCLSHQ